MKEENITFSNAETCLIMEPMHGNSQGNVHGGELMKIMDNIAGIVGFKHSKGAVVTARVDELVFHNPINIGDIITCMGQLAYVGTSSMQIIVKIVVHDLNNYSQPKTALSAFFTMVHLKNGLPSPVTKLFAKTKEDEELYKLGERKYLEIKAKFN